MKRFICLLLVTVLCLTAFTGCAEIEGFFGGIFGGETKDDGIDNAKKFLEGTYKTLEGSHSKDFDVVAQVVIAGVKYPVSWSASDSSVKIRESVKTGFYTVDVPSDNTSDLNFTLTATISSPNSKETRESSFSINVPAATAADVLSIPAAIDLGKEQATNQYTSEKYYVTGKITKIENDTYGNIRIADDKGNEILIYGTYDVTGKIRFDAFTTKPVVGDTITVYGAVGNYNGTPQLKNAWLTALNGESLGTPSQGGNNSGNSGNGGSDSTGGTVLDLMGTTNLQSNSANQTVYSANGITYTNDKASSTTDNYSGISTYAARAYGGSTIKIEYTGMTKIVITFDDYVTENGKSYMSGFDGMTVEGATFVRENDILTIYLAAATNVFQSASLTSQVRIEKIEVFTGAVETPPTGDNGGNDSGNEGAYTAPVEGQGYVLMVEQKNISKTLYFNGKLEDKRFLTTENKADAIVIYFESVEGGYHIYVKDASGTKNYINLAPYIKDNTSYLSCRLALETTPNCVWTFNETYGSLHAYTEFEGRSDTFFLATYDSWTTISLSASSFMDKIATGNQFPARFILADGNEGGNTGNEGGNTGNEGGNTGNEGGNTGNEGGNTGNEGGNTGNEGGTTAPEVTGSASLDFSDAGNRTFLDNNKQVWEQNGIKLTNDKSGSNVNVADYSKPARFYANSSLTIEYTKIVKIEFTCNNNSYADALVNSISSGSEYSVSANEKVVTIVFSTAVDSFTVAKFAAQVRVDSLTVYSGTAGGNTGNEGGNTDNEGGNTGNEGGNTGNEGGNTGNEGGNTGDSTSNGLPSKITFVGLVNRASADSYLKENHPTWTITGKLGNGYADYLGFGRSGDEVSSITSPDFDTDKAFTVTAVLKGNGSNGAFSSTLTFTLVDENGNLVATGYAEGSDVAAIMPVDGKDTTYNISFTFVEGKTWSDASNLVLSFAKDVGNIGLKSLEFVQ